MDTGNYSVFFFPRDIFRFARDTFWKSARDFEKMPVTKNPKFCPWKLTSCPWQKSQKNAREKRKVALTIFANFAKVPVTISDFCPWQNKKCQWQTSYFSSEICIHQLKLTIFFFKEEFIGHSFIHSKPGNFAFLPHKRRRKTKFFFVYEEKFTRHSFKIW